LVRARHTADEREEVRDLVAVRAVVLGHHARDVGEREAADAFLRSRAVPLRAGDAAEQLAVRSARAREDRDAARGVLLLVGAVPRGVRAVEVLERRVLLAEEARDALAVGLALEVGEVPHVLDEREAAATRTNARLPRREGGRRL